MQIKDFQESQATPKSVLIFFLTSYKLTPYTLIYMSAKLFLFMSETGPRDGILKTFSRIKLNCHYIRVFEFRIKFS